MFIPIEKMKKLREAAQTGDADAKRIIAMQMKGADGLEEAINEYFNPVQAEPEPEPAQEGVSADTDTPAPAHKHWMDDSLTEPQPEVEAQQPDDPTKELHDGIVSLVGACDKAIMDFAGNDDMSPSEAKGALVTLQEIKQSLIEAMGKLKGLKPKIETPAEEGL